MRLMRRVFQQLAKRTTQSFFAPVSCSATLASGSTCLRPPHARYAAGIRSGRRRRTCVTHGTRDRGRELPQMMTLCGIDVHGHLAWKTEHDGDRRGIGRSCDPHVRPAQAACLTCIPDVNTVPARAANERRAYPCHQRRSCERAVEAVRCRRGSQCLMHRDASDWITGTEAQGRREEHVAWSRHLRDVSRWLTPQLSCGRSWCSCSQCLLATYLMPSAQPDAGRDRQLQRTLGDRPEDASMQHARTIRDRLANTDAR